MDFLVLNPGLLLEILFLRKQNDVSLKIFHFFLVFNFWFELIFFLAYHDEIDEGNGVEIDAPPVHDGHEVDLDHGDGEDDHHGGVPVQAQQNERHHEDGRQGVAEILHGFHHDSEVLLVEHVKDAVGEDAHTQRLGHVVGHGVGLLQRVRVLGRGLAHRVVGHEVGRAHRLVVTDEVHALTVRGVAAVWRENNWKYRWENQSINQSINGSVRFMSINQTINQ